MAYEFPDLAVYQARWFADYLTLEGVRWTPWKTVQEWEFLEIRERIKLGEKYQVRILRQHWIDGYGIDYLSEHPEITVNPGI